MSAQAFRIADIVFAEKHQDQIDNKNEGSILKFLSQKTRNLSINIKRLGEDECSALSSMLHHTYSAEHLYNLDGRITSKPIIEYPFIVIPKIVIERWKEWKNTNYFDCFFIKADENLQLSVLIGKKDCGGEYFLAQWAYSEEYLMSDKELSGKADDYRKKIQQEFKDSAAHFTGRRHRSFYRHHR